MRMFLAPLPLLALLALGAAGQKTEKAVSFREDVEPLLKADCTGCHSKEAKQGGFVTEGLALFIGGSKFAKRVVVPGKPAESALIGYLRGKHQPQMPIGMPPLKEAQIQTIERWIAQGAKIDEAKLSWPYLAPTNPAAPRIKNPVLRDVSIVLVRPQGSSIQNMLPCVVDAVAPDAQPSQVLVRLACGECFLLARVTARAADALALAPGLQVWAQVKSVALAR